MSKIFDNLKNIYNKHRWIVSFGIFIGLFLLLAFYMKGKGDTFSLLKKLSIGDVLLLVSVSLLFKFMVGVNFRVLISFFNIKLVFKQWFGLTCVAAMANYVLPAKAGLATQALYLKRTYSFKFTNFISSMAGFYAVTFLVNSLSGIFMSGYIFCKGQAAGFEIFIFFCLTAMVTAALLSLVYFCPKFSVKFKIIQNFLDGLCNFHNKHKLAFFLVLSQVGVILAVGLRLLVAFKVIGIEIDLISCMIIALITSFSIFISITPGNLGIKEFFITFSSNILGISPDQALMVAMIDRAVDVIVSLITGYSFTYILAIKKVDEPLDLVNNEI